MTEPKKKDDQAEEPKPKKAKPDETETEAEPKDKNKTDAETGRVFGMLDPRLTGRISRFLDRAEAKENKGGPERAPDEGIKPPPVAPAKVQRTGLAGFGDAIADLFGSWDEEDGR